MDLSDAGSSHKEARYPMSQANFSFLSQSLTNIHRLPEQLSQQMLFSSSAVQTTSGNIQARPGSIQATPGNIQAMPGNIQATPGNIRVIPINIRATPGNVRARTGNSQGMPGNLAQPAANQTKKLEMPAAKRAKLDFDDGGSDSEEGHVRSANKQSSLEKRSQHCEVEKRRRERMNRYMAELAQMIPACTAVPRRLDKLSILKMTVDHMRNLRGDHTSSDYKPGFLTDEEMKQLVVEAANGFLFIIDCNQAKVLFVSDTITAVLNEEPNSWTGSCLYDLLHPKDVQKVKEQLITVDAKDDGVISAPIASASPHVNGLRRSFLCRVKRSSEQESVPGSAVSRTSEEDCSNSESDMRSSQHCVPCHYATLHCTGFIRHLTASEKQAMQVNECNLGACLVTVARLQHFGDNVLIPKLEPVENEFVFRVGSDGRFTFADPRITCVLGYLPQDLIGEVSYEYYHPDDIQKMVHLHHDAMKQRTPMATVQYRFLTKSQKWLWLAMKAFSFTNPFSQQVDYVVCTNVTMLRSSVDPQVYTSVYSINEDIVAASAAANNSIISDGICQGKTPDDMDRHDRIERYLPMTIHNQTPLPPLSLQARTFSVEEKSTTSLTHGVHFQSAPPLPLLYNTSTSSEGLSTETATTLEDNAATVQRILEDYNRMNVLPHPRKDMSNKLTEAMSNTEMGLPGSQQTYRNILTEFDNPADFALLFDQVESDSMQPSNMLQDLSMDINF